MTREQANKIAKAVDDIEAFECFKGFMDTLDGAIQEGIEIWGMSESDVFIIELRRMMENELKFREQLLEAM